MKFDMIRLTYGSYQIWVY